MSLDSQASRPATVGFRLGFPPRPGMRSSGSAFNSMTSASRHGERLWATRPPAALREIRRHVDLGDVSKGETGECSDFGHREPFSHEIWLLLQRSN
jgi:hypothetical protein